MFGELGIIGLIGLILAVYAILKIVKSGADTLVKVLWIVAVLIFPIIGFIAWLIFGPK